VTARTRAFTIFFVLDGTAFLACLLSLVWFHSEAWSAAGTNFLVLALIAFAFLVWPARNDYGPDPQTEDDPK
jgi:hypothetical protein